MDVRILNLIGLSLVLTLGVVANDGRAAQAGQHRIAPCDRPCSSRYRGVRTPDGRIPPEAIASIEALINSGQAKVDNYLILADIYSLEGNYDLAQARLSQGLELSNKDRDIEGQAIAHTRLGEVFTKTGNLKQASSHLTVAKNLYGTLNNKQELRIVDQQLRRVFILQRQNNPSQRLIRLRQ